MARPADPDAARAFDRDGILDTAAWLRDEGFPELSKAIDQRLDLLERAFASFYGLLLECQVMQDALDRR